MPSNSKQVGQLTSMFENLSTVSLRFKELEDERDRSVSPSSVRALPQFSGNELKNVYNPLLTPRGGKKRYLTPPPSSHLSPNPFKIPDTTDTDKHKVGPSSPLRKTKSFSTVAKEQAKAVPLEAIRDLGIITPSQGSTSAFFPPSPPKMDGDKEEAEAMQLCVPQEEVAFLFDEVSQPPSPQYSDPERPLQSKSTASRSSEDHELEQLALCRDLDQEAQERASEKIGEDAPLVHNPDSIDSKPADGLGIHMHVETNHVVQMSHDPENLGSAFQPGLGIRLEEGSFEQAHDEPDSSKQEINHGLQEKDDLGAAIHSTPHSPERNKEDGDQHVAGKNMHYDLTSGKFPDRERADRHEGEGEDDSGLGINFYNHRAVARRTQLLERGKLDVAHLLRLSQSHLQSLENDHSDVFEVSRLPQALECRSEGNTSAKTLEPAAPPQDDGGSNGDEDDYVPAQDFDLDSNSSIEPGDISLSLIENLLEDNYRGQAETFARNSSASIRSRSSSARNTPNPASATPSVLRSSSTPIYTPTRQPKQGESFATSQRRLPETPIEPDTPTKVFSERFTVLGGSAEKRSGLSPEEIIPHTTYVLNSSTGHQFYAIPAPQGEIVFSRTRPDFPIETATRPRDKYHFTEAERQAITNLVLENHRECLRHENCTECLQLEYAYYENKAMPTSIPPEERQKIINNNRSLRNIKNELESLVEHDAISDDIYDKIMSLLPTESSLNGSTARTVAPSPSPVPSAAFNNLNLGNNDVPPAYNNPTPPTIPGRQASTPPSKPEIWRATALYRYAVEGDCNFEVGDQISVLTEMNNDWWMGKNLRTGQEGVFPSNYVQKQLNQSPLDYYGHNEKSSGYAGGYPGLAMHPQQQQGIPPPGAGNPYNSSVPPMAVAEQPTEGKHPGKGQEMGKKFGKKLGNAAIFGAGATIGGNIVNSIF